MCLQEYMDEHVQFNLSNERSGVDSRVLKTEEPMFGLFFNPKVSSWLGDHLLLCFGPRRWRELTDLCDLAAAALRPLAVEARWRGLITGRELSAMEELRGLGAVL
jgi:hypothetical protein